MTLKDISDRGRLLTSPSPAAGVDPGVRGAGLDPAGEVGPGRSQGAGLQPPAPPAERLQLRASATACEPV